MTTCSAVTRPSIAPAKSTSRPAVRAAVAFGAKYDPEKPLVLLIPLALRLGPEGFEELDHDGNVRARLSAIELCAVATFREESTFAVAFERQAAELGDLALTREALSELAQRLWTAGLLRAFDPTDLAFRRGTTRIRAIMQFKRLGRDAVANRRSP